MKVILILCALILCTLSAWAVSLPASVDLSSHVINNMGERFKAGMRIHVHDFRIWGWSSNGRFVAFSLADVFVIQDLVNDQFVVEQKTDLSSTEAIDGLQKVFQKYNIKSVEQPQIMPFPQTINGAEYVANIDNLEVIGGLTDYKVAVSKNGIRKEIGFGILHGYGNPPKPYVLGFVPNPLEDRMLVLTAEESIYNGEVYILLSFRGCHLTAGFDGKTFYVTIGGSVSGLRFADEPVHGNQLAMGSLPLSTNMVFVEGGTFTMGGDDKLGNGGKEHKVTLSSFYIGKYEVTQEEWLTIMGTNPSHFKGNNRPVEDVTWGNVIEYCNKRSLAEGLTPVYSGKGDNITVDWAANGYR
ncbi:MAG: SUMF1/EgtB/PvdO family nonheme iron enzyme, partial [Deferribacteraceae bacterium]|nr:SUMF1/EgtB/PvdO family nonheme iron enzyme [Deferribacteraceae bacterium]